MKGDMNENDEWRMTNGGSGGEGVWVLPRLADELPARWCEPHWQALPVLRQGVLAYGCQMRRAREIPSTKPRTPRPGKFFNRKNMEKTESNHI